MKEEILKEEINIDDIWMEVCSCVVQDAFINSIHVTETIQKLKDKFVINKKL